MQNICPICKNNMQEICKICKKICRKYTQNLAKYAENMQKICKKYAKNMHKVCKNIDPKCKTCQKNAKNMHKICTKYALYKQKYAIYGGSINCINLQKYAPGTLLLSDSPPSRRRTGVTWLEGTVRSLPCRPRAVWRGAGGLPPAGASEGEGAGEGPGGRSGTRGPGASSFKFKMEWETVTDSERAEERTRPPSCRSAPAAGGRGSGCFAGQSQRPAGGGRSSLSGAAAGRR